MARLFRQVPQPALLALFLTTLLLAATIQSRAGTDSNAEFDGLSGLSRHEKAANYLHSWGSPDLFMISLMPSSLKSGKPVRTEFWIYSRRGTELLFRDGVLQRQYYFDPKQADELLPSSGLSPQDYSISTTAAALQQKLGAPTRTSRSSVAGEPLDTLEYRKEGSSPDTFSFSRGALVYVSAGFRPGMENPWETYVSRPSRPADLAPVLGVWSSQLGTLVLKRAADHAGVVAGRLSTYKSDKQKGQGLLSGGSFDKATGFLKLNLQMDYENIDGHGEFLLAPDGRRLCGSFIVGRECWPWVLVRK